ncbi:hypothetical protein [Oceanospirillum beijerinckii]|uniref:hypothetical protein n=1 Tax=Oceanospirillum beijerinckii TaxID=64976 RepID=UPI0004271088|nr:hypothetical protein [Oceanospirillum beijerinckii]
MRIQQGQISFISAHESRAYTEKEEKIRYFERTPEGERTLEMESRSVSAHVALGMHGVAAGEETLPNLPGRNGKGLGLGLSFAPANGQDKFDRDADSVVKASEVEESEDDFPDNIEELKLRTLVHLMEQVFGGHFKLIDSDELQKIDENAKELNEIADKMEGYVGSPNATPGDEQPQYGWRMDYHSEQTYHEEEFTRFAASGHVTTADGRKIDLQLELGLSRSFQSKEVMSVVSGTLKDPLVINFDSSSVGLKDHETFRFDIDADGKVEDLSQLTAGSGFLALDKDGDGKINNGTELFGAQSGNGFADLRAYDEDGDGFLDEDDAAFSQLRIWVPDAEGNGQLYALLDKNVGAIYLGNADTKFSLNRSSDNEQLGLLRSSGVFLKEDGGVGTVQQIDLKV